MTQTLSRMGWSPPETMDEYRLVRLIGRGGMGQIYLAEDALLERPVAVKFIASVKPDESARQRFYVEARALARLSHPNVVAVHRVGEVDGRPYLVTEFVRGQSLEELPKPLRWERVLHIGLGLARGLAAAHRQGVLHRDIKPANVMLAEDGQVKLLDFGLAKLLEAPPAEEPGAQGPCEPAGPPGALTGSGGILGTPLYMAPETLRGEQATRRSDVYSLGAVLYELCTGISPRQTMSDELSFEDWIAAEPAPISQLAPDVAPRLAAIISRCMRREPESRLGSVDELCGVLEELGPDRPTGEVPEGNPYRGLRPFEADHRALFFGRSTEIRAVIERLRSESLIVVAGDSGVGKSSLCRAGVLPLVAEGGLGDGRRYRLLSLVPGRSPLAALASSFAGVFEMDEGTTGELIRSDPQVLGRELRRAQGRTAGTLVFVDQLEELFTLGDREEVARFSELIIRLGTVPGVRVLMAVRGDYFTRLASLPGLGAEISRALYLLRPLSPEATRAAITGPAQQKGFLFESSAMVQELVEASTRAVGGLPLLQFAMAELWEARDEARHIIPVSALSRMGGVAGALARHADGVLENLLPEQRRMARRLLLQLVTPEGTRIRRTGVDLGIEEPTARAALEALVRGRLLVASEADEDTCYEVAHESLLQAWSTLRRWLDSDGELRQLRERIETAAAEWARLERTQEALWRERQLAEVGRVDPEELSLRGRSFLLASRRRIRHTRYTRLALILLVPVLGGITLGAVHYNAQSELHQRIADYEKAGDDALKAGRSNKEKATARKHEAYGAFDAVSGKSEKVAAEHRNAAEAFWAEALLASQQADDDFLRAGQMFEAALALGPAEAHLRGKVAEVLRERIELAEGFHHHERRKEQLQRVEAYDDGTRRQWLQASPRLSIVTEPPGAEVLLERYEDDRKGYRKPVFVRALGKTPLESVEIHEGPGSYRLTFRAPERATVRHPLLLARGEQLAISLPHPREAVIPEGFVWIPPGRFLFGSADPEGMRRGIMKAPPLHQMSLSHGYLIARTEVTFRDWIQFLESSGDARERFLPGADMHDWSMKLKRTTGGVWQLQLVLKGRRLELAEGEPLELPERDRRRSQDWRLLPVSGIDFEAAQAYVAWLREEGRVPGARICDEREWERAARGADDRIYPHGGHLGFEDANFDETYGRKPHALGPDEVGSHPASVSPFDVFDMTGNVYEWTRSMGASGEVVIRGGAWYYDSVSVLTANRTVVEPKTRDMMVGLRVCADAPRFE